MVCFLCLLCVFSHCVLLHSDDEVTLKFVHLTSDGEPLKLIGLLSRDSFDNESETGERGNGIVLSNVIFIKNTMERWVLFFFQEAMKSKFQLTLQFLRF